MKKRERDMLTTSHRRGMEMIIQKVCRKFPPWKLAPAHPASAPSARGGRLRILAMLAAAAILLATGPRPVTSASQQYEALKVPDFSILANDGMTYSPDYLKGNVVLFMFWATWCPYCKKAMPHMSTFANEYANAPFTLLGICGSKDPDAWRTYIQQYQLRWPQYWDKGHRMANLFGANGVPNFFLIDKDGYLVAHWVGWDNSMTDQVEKLIDHTLAQPSRR